MSQLFFLVLDMLAFWVIKTFHTRERTEILHDIMHYAESLEVFEVVIIVDVILLLCPLKSQLISTEISPFGDKKF